MRYFLCFLRIARDSKNNAREGVKMRHFRAKITSGHTTVTTRRLPRMSSAAKKVLNEATITSKIENMTPDTEKLFRKWCESQA